MPYNYELKLHRTHTPKGINRLKRLADHPKGGTASHDVRTNRFWLKLGVRGTQETYSLEMSGDVVDLLCRLRDEKKAHDWDD